MTTRITRIMPTIWLLEGIVEVKGDEYAFWYEYDHRDDSETLEFCDQDPYDVYGFDYDHLLKFCRTEVKKHIKERGWKIK